MHAAAHWVAKPSAAMLLYVLYRQIRHLIHGTCQLPVLFDMSCNKKSNRNIYIYIYVYIRGLWSQKQVSQAGIINCIPQHQSPRIYVCDLVRKKDGTYWICPFILPEWNTTCQNESLGMRYCYNIADIPSLIILTLYDITLQWRHNGCDSVSNHLPHDYLLNRLFRRRWKKTSKLSVTGLCAPRTNGQLRGKCFHLMTSSWRIIVVREEVFHIPAPYENS